jgi:hypothetical protein
LGTETIPAENITGKCYIQHPSAITDLKTWTSYENHFYVQDCSTKPSFVGLETCNELETLDMATHIYCISCYNEHIKMLKRQDLLFKRNKPLQALELFSGSFTLFMIVGF